MNITNKADIIRAIQKQLGLLVDGIPGEQTWRGIYRALVGEIPSIPMPAVAADRVDERSEKNIATLHPKVQPIARALVVAVLADGITIKITDGTRTYQEQDLLYRQPTDGKDNNGNGRIDEPSETVTKAPAGHSNHNFGLGFDITIFVGGIPVYESPLYKKVGAIGKSLGLVWGGDWKSPTDEPHFELHPPWAAGMSEEKMLAILRARHEEQRDAFV